MNKLKKILELEQEIKYKNTELKAVWKEKREVKELKKSITVDNNKEKS